MAYSTSDIRNIALVGAGAGKTPLTESLLLEAGVIRSRGSLERGTTVCDFDPQEKQLRHSLDAALVHLPAGGRHVHLFDTPGYPDFAGRDLATRRGRVSGSHSLANQRSRISALVPLAEINDYQSRIESLTGGEGAYTPSPASGRGARILPGERRLYAFFLNRYST